MEFFEQARRVKSIVFISRAVPHSACEQHAEVRFISPLPLHVQLLTPNSAHLPTPPEDGLIPYIERERRPCSYGTPTQNGGYSTQPSPEEQFDANTGSRSERGHDAEHTPCPSPPQHRQRKSYWTDFGSPGPSPSPGPPPTTLANNTAGLDEKGARDLGSAQLC